MDFLNSMKGQEGSAQTQPMEPNKQGGDTGMMGKLNGMMGGGAQSENKEGKHQILSMLRSHI